MKNEQSSKKLEFLKVNLSLAGKYGDREAMLIEYFRFHIQNNINDNVGFYDGHTWTFHSRSKIVKQLSFWSEQTFRTTLDSLINKGVILKQHQKARNNTMSYCFINEADFLDLTQKYKEKVRLVEINQPNDEPLFTNEQTTLPITANHLVEINQPNDKVVGENKLNAWLKSTNLFVESNKPNDEPLGWNQPTTWLESTNHLVEINQPIYRSKYIDVNSSLVSLVSVNNEQTEILPKKELIQEMSLSLSLVDQEDELINWYQKNEEEEELGINEIIKENIKQSIMEKEINDNKRETILSSVESKSNKLDFRRIILTYPDYTGLTALYPNIDIQDELDKWIPRHNANIQSGHFIHETDKKTFNLFVGWLKNFDPKKNNQHTTSAKKNKAMSLFEQYQLLDNEGKDKLETVYANLQVNIPLSPDFNRFMVFVNLIAFKNKWQQPEEKFYTILFYAIKRQTKLFENKNERPYIQDEKQLGYFIDEFINYKHQKQVIKDNE